jgi:hypothetical protein
MLYHVGFLLSLWRFSDGVSYLVGRVFQLLFYVYGIKDAKGSCMNEDFPYLFPIQKIT